MSTQQSERWHWRNHDRFVDPDGRRGKVVDADAGALRVVYDDGERALLGLAAAAELRPIDPVAIGEQLMAMGIAEEKADQQTSNELQAKLQLRHEGKLVVEGELGASALRGLCALALVNLVGTIVTMQEQESGLDEYIPKVDVHEADNALMVTEPGDYEAAFAWLVETIHASRGGQ